MGVFTKDDGRTVQIVPGTRQRVISARASFSPRDDWGDTEYAAAAAKKLRRTDRLLSDFTRFGGRIEGAHVLDVACGDGINALLLALQPVESVTGIDLELPLVEDVERGQRTRRLAGAVLEHAGRKGELDQVLEQLPLTFVKMDATNMDFPASSFDLLTSRSAIEHIMPVEKAFSEMARVVRPGGLVHLSTDPYFSPRGCHKTGVVDIPWAHARLSRGEYSRFVSQSEGEAFAKRRDKRLETLNPYTIRQWRDKIETEPFEVLEWREEISSVAQELLREHPEVVETVFPGVEQQDLVNERLQIWLRRRSDE